MGVDGEHVRSWGDCVAKLTAPSVGLGVSEWGALIARPPSGGSVADIFDELGLRSAGGWRHRRWSSDILGELSQVLGGGDEQNLVAGAAQAPQPQPVELHVMAYRSQLQRQPSDAHPSRKCPKAASGRTR